jgi:chemotaxis signal transduction protein
MADNQTATAARDAGPSKMLKFLIFQLGRLKFALRILGVNDIVAVNRYDEAESVSRSVANSVGREVPVVDLRPQALSPTPRGRDDDAERFFVIVVEAEYARGPLPVGLVVDRRAEILDFNACEVAIPTEACPASQDVRLGSRTVTFLKVEDVLPNVIRLDDHLISLAAGCAS